jgi:two-component system CheB/CheR fusion protein
MPAPDEPIDNPLHSGESSAGLSNETVQVGRGNPADISPPRGHAFPIVGIGASAGGLDAFKRLLKALPDNTGMAFVLVQHLDPYHESLLPEILTGATKMPVHAVEDGVPVRPNEVFVIPPNRTMILEDGVLRLSDRKPGLHLPIDAFFESLAHVQGGRAIAIVLSGNASDGTLGVRAIKEECGLTFAQAEETAQHTGMPRNAVATGAIDYVLSPEDIAKELARLSRHPFVRSPQPGDPAKENLPEGDGELKKILGLMRTATKVDFSHYKQNTVRRRIGRRMIVKRARTMAEYVRVLSEHDDEVRELYRDLLISVTNFFRDPEIFDALSRHLRGMLEVRNASEPFRVWVPGCATGEELYSLAICLRELLDEMQLQTPIQLFGTDISDIALERARAALYPELIAQDVSPERLRRFFVRVDRGYEICKAIREACVFARQDVTNDPPFSHIDLISCRNLLIYLDAVLQRKVLPVFHYSLNPTGLLLLGSAESIAQAIDLR